MNMKPTISIDSTSSAVEKSGISYGKEFGQLNGINISEKILSSQLKKKVFQLPKRFENA
jgi:hypothetical protein